MQHQQQQQRPPVTATAKRRRTTALTAPATASATAGRHNDEDNNHSGGGGDDDNDDVPVRARAVVVLPNPGRGARVAPATGAIRQRVGAATDTVVDAAALAEMAASRVLVTPPKPPRPPCAVTGLPRCVDYLDLLFKTRDTELVRREIGWIVDEVEHRHPRFDTRLLRFLRGVAAASPPKFLAWHYMVIAYAPDLPDMQRRLASATPWHRLEPILHHWRDEFFVFSNAMHTFYEPANDAIGKPRAYTDWIDFTIRMRFDYDRHYDMGGRWTATIPRALPRPLEDVGVAADPRAWVAQDMRPVPPRQQQQQ